MGLYTCVIMSTWESRSYQTDTFAHNNGINKQYGKRKDQNLSSKKYIDFPRPNHIEIETSSVKKTTYVLSETKDKEES